MQLRRYFILRICPVYWNMNKLAVREQRRDQGPNSVILTALLGSTLWALAIHYILISYVDPFHPRSYATLLIHLVKFEIGHCISKISMILWVLYQTFLSLKQLNLKLLDLFVFAVPFILNFIIVLEAFEIFLLAIILYALQQWISPQKLILTNTKTNELL